MQNIGKNIIAKYFISLILFLLSIYHLLPPINLIKGAILNYFITDNINRQLHIV